MNQCTANKDYGPGPDVINVKETAEENCIFRTAVWTGCHLQMTVMAIPPCSDIGLEIHTDTDQMIRVEAGCGMVLFGKCKNQPDYKYCLRTGDAVFVPAGTWHNIKNTGETLLKLSSVYAPPKHPKGTVHMTKEDALLAEY